jgi:hypothetical protein
VRRWKKGKKCETNKRKEKVQKEEKKKKEIK